ncbi:hypothetical protein BH23VER1_BH23VER1_22800 [soil metagenome]
MKIPLSLASGLALIAFGLSPAIADLDTLEVWGNAADTNPAGGAVVSPGFTNDGSTITITGGGADIWGGSDQGVFLWDSTGELTYSGDFSATVRHVSTSTPAPEWGRDGLDARVLQDPEGAALPMANDAHWMAIRRSNGSFTHGIRRTVAGGTDDDTDPDTAGNQRNIAPGAPNSQPLYLSIGRDGDTMRAAHALDLGGGTPGRWVERTPWTVPAFASGTEMVLGLVHQSHSQSIGGTDNDINTATFDMFSPMDSFDPSFFGPAASPDTWQLMGRLDVNAAGEVVGGAFVEEGGVATGEGLLWMLRGFNKDTFVPAFGVTSRRDPNPMEAADLVPPENFRYDTTGGGDFEAGLLAEIYRGPNGGNGNLATVADNEPLGVAVVPNVNWSNPSAGIGYPPSDTGNVFTDAVPGDGTNANPAFGDDGNSPTDMTGLNDGVPDANGEDDFGINHVGQIFIPAAADRQAVELPGGENWILFEDATDDFAYLQIDGQVLIQRNSFTNVNATANGGGSLAIFDASDPKFDEGAWVDFQMVSWEGGGGDNARLFWSVNDTNGSFDILLTPGTFGDFVPMAGVASAVQDTTAMNPDDIVPAANFRFDDGGTFEDGLVADIYLAANGGNRAANFATIDGNAPDGTAIIPDVSWTGGSNNDANYYGLTGPASFGVAVQGVDPADGLAGAFSGNQDNYGVDINGQIFIPADADRTPVTSGGEELEAILFTDGVDDYTYLEIDGQVLLDDNSWTGYDSSQNNGGHVSLFDASDPKFDEGAWVDFRMVTWEGGGGDAGVLYWSALDTDGTFDDVSLPGAFVSFDPISGTTQVGDESTDGPFGASVENGEWLFVLDLVNTGSSAQVRTVVEVTDGTGEPDPAPFRITDIVYDEDADQFTLTWLSEDGATYDITWSTDLEEFADTAATGIEGEAGTTTFGPFDNPSPDAERLFLRIERAPAVEP